MSPRTRRRQNRHHSLAISIAIALVVFGGVALLLSDQIAEWAGPLFEDLLTTIKATIWNWIL